MTEGRRQEGAGCKNSARRGQARAERDGDEQQPDQARARRPGHNEEVVPAVKHWGPGNCGCAIRHTAAARLWPCPTAWVAERPSPPARDRPCRLNYCVRRSQIAIRQAATSPKLADNLLSDRTIIATSCRIAAVARSALPNGRILLLEYRQQ